MVVFYFGLLKKGGAWPLSKLLTVLDTAYTCSSSRPCSLSVQIPRGVEKCGLPGRRRAWWEGKVTNRGRPQTRISRSTTTASARMAKAGFFRREMNHTSVLLSLALVGNTKQKIYRNAGGKKPNLLSTDVLTSSVDRKCPQMKSA